MMGAGQWTFFMALVLFGVRDSDETTLYTTREVNENDGTSMKRAIPMNVYVSSNAETRERRSPTGVKTDTTARSGNKTLTSDDKIVGGRDTIISSHPYQLHMVSGGFGCGATIISNYWVVTAAHCLYDDNKRPIPKYQISFRAGSTYLGTGGSTHTVERIVIPEKYSPRGTDYDFALLKVRNPFRFSYSVQPITLPSDGEEVPEGRKAELTGWGLTRAGGRGSRILQEVTLRVVSRARCLEIYRRGITERMFCANGRGKDTCQGDSGGPMVVDGKLVGVVSFGVGCADERYPGVYTKVSAFRGAIRKVTGI